MLCAQQFIFLLPQYYDKASLTAVILTLCDKAVHNQNSPHNL